MNRTNRPELLPRAAAYIAGHSRQLFFALLFLTGVLLGIIAFLAGGQEWEQDLALMLKVRGVPKGFPGALSALMASCLAPFLMIGLLFLLGMSACGVPFTLIAPLFYGLGLGMTEAYYYSTGWAGVGFSALLVVPHSLIAGMALILAGAEAARMSMRLSAQLLPDAPMGGLWPDFRQYVLRFFLYLILALISGMVDVCLRLLFSFLFV